MRILNKRLEKGKKMIQVASICFLVYRLLGVINVIGGLVAKIFNFQGIMESRSEWNISPETPEHIRQ